jgi:hypothetical protein
MYVPEILRAMRASGSILNRSAVETCRWTCATVAGVWAWIDHIHCAKTLHTRPLLGCRPCDALAVSQLSFLARSNNSP